MSMIKRRLYILGIFMIILMLSSAPLIIHGAGDNKDLLIEALNGDVSKTYHTTTIKRMDFHTDGQLKGQVIFPENDKITVTDHYAKMYFISYLVDFWDMVDKGDAIAELGVVVDREKVEELKLSIQREENNLTALTDQYNKLVLQYKETKYHSNNENERLLAELLLEQLELNYQQEKQSKDLSVKELKKQYHELQSLNKSDEKIYVYATRKGRILELNKFMENDNVEAGTFIATVADISKIFVSVTDQSSVLKYHMPVTVTQNGISRDGRVITCEKKLLSPNLVSENALIELPKVDISKYKSPDVTVTYKTADMKNALVVESDAIKKDEYGTYVNLLVDGLQKRQYIICGGSSGNMTWILRGANEGDVVLINES